VRILLSIYARMQSLTEKENAESGGQRSVFKR